MLGLATTTGGFLSPWPIHNQLHSATSAGATEPQPTQILLHAATNPLPNEVISKPSRPTIHNRSRTSLCRRNRIEDRGRLKTTNVAL